MARNTPNIVQRMYEQETLRYNKLDRSAITFDDAKKVHQGYREALSDVLAQLQRQPLFVKEPLNLHKGDIAGIFLLSHGNFARMYHQRTLKVTVVSVGSRWITVTDGMHKWRCDRETGCEESLNEGIVLCSSPGEAIEMEQREMMTDFIRTFMASYNKFDRLSTPALALIYDVLQACNDTINKNKETQS